MSEYIHGYNKEGIGHSTDASKEVPKDIEDIRRNLIEMEVITLRAENAKLEGQLKDQCDTTLDLARDICTLRADLARLRELLGEVVKYDEAIRSGLTDKHWSQKMNNWNDVISRVQSELERK